MTDKDLEIFRLVAELGSNSEAARRLGISQSSVSRTITALENEFGTKLLNRDTIPITLTSNGIVLVNFIDDGMSIKQRFKRYIEEQSMKQLKIGFSFPVSCSMFSNELSKFKQNEPSIIMKTYSGDNIQIRDMVAKGELDVALLPDRMNFCDYRTTPLIENFEWGLVVPGGVPLTDRHFVCPEEIGRLPLLIPVDMSSHKAVEQWFGDQERIQLSDTYNSIETLTELLTNGYGAGFAPRVYIAHLERYNIAFYLLSPKIFTSIYIYTNTRDDRMKIIEPFLELLYLKFR